MRYRVLVVDADPLACRELARAVEREGHDVAWYSGVADALDAAGEVPPDAVIAGLRIGETAGTDLIGQLEAMDPQIASLLVTSATDKDGAAEAHAVVGPLRHVHKPVDPSDLIPKLSAQLVQRQLVCDLHAMQATLAQREAALRARKREMERTEAALEDTHSELETATERLVRAEQMAAVGRVVAGVAHELERQLALVGYAEAIKSRVSGDPELAELADIIVAAQKRLVGMVEEIRDFATGDQDEVIDREPADLAGVVDEALHILEFDPDGRKRTLERSFHARPLVLLHRQKFSQVVLNLVSNAVLATEPGDTVTIELDVDRRRKLAVLTVVDRGCGMPGEVLRRLGEPFFTTRGDRGSGLGVGICKRIVIEHGGALVFESEVGKGTTARVTLPLLPGAEEVVG